jgi:RNA polymerase sigma factor (sigma-70 family)
MHTHDEMWSRLLDLRPALFRLAMSRTGDAADAEDCVQEAFLRAAQYADLDLERVEPFLVVLVSRIATDVHRRRARDSRLGERLASRAVPQSTFEDEVCDRAEATWVRESLGHLGKRERAVVEAMGAGLTIGETAESLGVSYKTAETALFRIRCKARALVQAGAAALVPLIPISLRLSRRSTVGRGGAGASAVAAAAVSVAVVTGGSVIAWQGVHHGHTAVQGAPRTQTMVMVPHHMQRSTRPVRGYSHHGLTGRQATTTTATHITTRALDTVRPGRDGGKPERPVATVPSRKAPGGNQSPQAQVKTTPGHDFVSFAVGCVKHPSFDTSSLICPGAS